VVEDENITIGKLSMLTAEEVELFEGKAKVIEPEIRDTKFTGIHQHIEAVALNNPAAIAITFGAESITYQQLNNRANRVAANILKTSKGESKIIGLCIGRSIEMIVGLLGILKSGSAYLPLDPEYPAERTKFILQDSKAKLILTEKQYSKNFDKLSIPSLDIFEIERSTIIEINALPKVSADNLAYVIYTSGSTGKPKGVPISHQNIICSTEARFSFYQEKPSAFLLLSSISFDSSKAGIFWTLCSGGNLVIAEKRMEQDMLLMEESIVKNNVCSIQLPKLHFKTLPKTNLYNEYGPTETTVWCIAYKLSNKDYDIVPIGKAIDGTKIHLLDTDLNHVPFGAVGEIYITGKGLASGYLHNEELSNTKFIANPFSEKDGYTHLYKSGDLGRYIDEVENTLLNHANVKEASVVITSNNESNTDSKGILVAYVIPRVDFNKAEVLAFLKKELPKHMVPSRVISLDFFAKLPNGKIDKKYLQSIPLEVSNASDKLIEPSSRTEKKLLQIWREVLGFNGLGVTDNFFEVGGDSIMTIQVIAKARKMGMAISPNQLFEYQTISELANFVDKNEEKEEQWDYIVPLRKEGKKKPLFCIHAGGGHVFFYNNLTNYLDADIPIYALQPSGLYGNTSMHITVEAMAASYLKAIRSKQAKGPYNILVYCFSAAVGNEMALLLKETGEQINLIVMDTMTAPRRF